MAETQPRPGKYDHLVFYMDLVGHDIIDNNQAVLGYLELMLANPRFDKTLRGYAEKAFSRVGTSTMHVENCKRLIAAGMRGEGAFGPLDVKSVLQSSEKELSKFFPDKKTSVRLGQMPKDARVLGDSSAEALIMNTMVSAVRMDPNEKAEIRAKMAQSMFRGRACWTITIEEPKALLPASLKGRDIKSVHLLDSSVAVKLSGMLFSKMMAEALGGDFDAYELPDAKDNVGAGFTITLRRAERK